MATKQMRITKKAACIRRASVTARLKRTALPDAPSFKPNLLTKSMSGKLTALVQKIKELDASDLSEYGSRFKHFIFTDIRDSLFGAKVIATALINAGFDFRLTNRAKTRKLKGKMVATKSGEVVFIEREPDPIGSQGFAILQSNPLWKKPTSAALKKHIIRIFNARPENSNGELLRIIVLDSKYKEGIDLFDVKYVHLMEPAIATSDLKQAVGRATRFCGQRGLTFIPRRGWPLSVYIYNTELPNSDPFRLGDGQKVSAHDLMLHYSGLDLAAINLVRELTMLAISAAVDYDLNYRINNFSMELGAQKPYEQRGGDIEIERCIKRKNKEFPFTVLEMAASARAEGIRTPRGSRRAWYCDLLSKNPEYYNRLLGMPINEKMVSGDTQDILQYETEDISTLPIEEFQKRIQMIYAAYKWDSPILKNGCESSDVVKSAVSFTKTQDFIRHYLTPKSPFKGLLAWHSVGTGKTCMAVAAATTTFERDGYSILWVTRNSLMADVFKNIFGAVCSIPIQEHIAAGKPIPEDAAAQKRMLSRAWFAPISYRTFQNALQKKNELGRLLYARNSADPLHKTFLIIDEVHKLYDGDLGAGESADFKTIQDYIFKSYSVSGDNSVRPLLMTATPISDAPQPLFDIINTLIPLEKQRLMTIDEFRTKYTSADGSIIPEGRAYVLERMKGLISYLNREYDPTTFAQPVFHTIAVPVGDIYVPTLEQLLNLCAGKGTGSKWNEYWNDASSCFKNAQTRFKKRGQDTQLKELHTCFPVTERGISDKFPILSDFKKEAKQRLIGNTENNNDLSSIGAVYR